MPDTLSEPSRETAVFGQGRARVSVRVRQVAQPDGQCAEAGIACSGHGRRADSEKHVQGWGLHGRRQQRVC